MTLTEKYSILESHRGRISVIEYWDNGIMYIELDDNAEVNLNDAKFHFEFLRSKYNGTKKMRVLTVPGRYTTATKEAREFSTMPETNKLTLGSAVVVKSLAHRIVINFIISFARQQNVHMRMFENKEKATEWLLALEDK